MDSVTSYTSFICFIYKRCALSIFQIVIKIEFKIIKPKLLKVR